MLKKISLVIAPLILILTFLLSINSISYAQNKLIAAVPKTAAGTAINVTVPTDNDHDGMPNFYEEKYELNPGDPWDAILDYDRDGLTNLQEYNIGTNPIIADTDGGGLSDGDEIEQGKNPLDPKDDTTDKKIPFSVTGYDSDMDGIPDIDELTKYLTNSLSKDSDADGLTDFEEIFTYFTDPNNKDTDFDLLTDFDEVYKSKTDPLEWDTDEGGNSDGDEINNNTNPLDPGDDIKINWRVFLGKKYFPGSTSAIFNKIDTVTDVNISAEAHIPEYTNYLVIKFDEKTSGILRKDTDTAEIDIPDHPGVFFVSLHFPADNPELSYIKLTKYVKVENRGTIRRKVLGDFGGTYNDIFEEDPVEYSKIAIYKYDDNTHNPVRLISEYFNYESPSYSDDEGKYVVLLDPGTYKIEFSKNLFINKELILHVDEPTIYSSNFFLNQNLDMITWGGIFTIIYSVVWFVISVLKYRFERKEEYLVPLKAYMRKLYNHK